MRLALTWLTVLPLRGPDTVDRAAATRAIAAAPLVGVLLGLGAAGLLRLLHLAGTPAGVAGVCVVAALALATRGMHLDGLSDTADGLGCYGPPERARAVMRGGTAGPFGVAAIAVVVLAQSAAFAELARAERWVAIVIAVAAGRVAVVLGCRRGIPAANGNGFGPLVAGTQAPAVGVGWALALTAGAVWATPRPWQGPLVTLAALAGAVLLIRHCVRRFGGLSGDVLGAAIETTVTLTAAGLTLGLAA